MCVLLTFGIITVIFLGQSSIKAKASSNKINNSSKIVPIETKDITKEDSQEKDKSRFDGIKLTDADIGVPILCYHSISESKDNELLLSPEKFKSQLKYLKDNGYTPITMDELYNFLKNNKSIPEKSVVITFDDGYRDNYTTAFPILKEFGFKATVYVISNFVENDLYMTKAQIKEMSDWGIDIESHTDNHEDLSKLTLDQQYETMKKSKEQLETILSKKVDYIAYPFGKFNVNTRKVAEKAGYKLGFSLAGGLADKGDNAYNIDRLYISNNYTIDEFITKLTKTKK
jgi:peptidoglycan/xylan/chitin deacetylase (PgdA/CDA1 family)